MNIPSFEIELAILQQRQRQRIALGFAIADLSFRLDWVATNKRLNEREAVVHSAYLEQFDQFLIPKFGSRRNGGEGLSSDQYPSPKVKYCLNTLLSI